VLDALIAAVGSAVGVRAVATGIALSTTGAGDVASAEAALGAVAKGVLFLGSRFE
jgi:hypothetical protein